MSVPFAAFGPGILICTRTDLTTPIAVNVGFAQELTLDFAGTTKQLYGQKQFPLVAARGTIKATGKWKAAVISGLAWRNVFYSDTFTSGGLAWSVDSTYTSSTAAPFTVQVGSSLTFDADLGVKYGSTVGSTVGSANFPLQRVATGSETTGTYSIASTQLGLYTFGGGTTSIATPLKITFTSTTTTGQSMVVTNQLIGNTPTFQLDYYTSLSQPTAKPFVVRVYSCVGAKHALGFKLEDFMMPEFDFDFFADASDRIVDYVFPEVS